MTVFKMSVHFALVPAPLQQSQSSRRKTIPEFLPEILPEFLPEAEASAHLSGYQIFFLSALSC